jgi:hypothetical protein
LPGSIKKIRLAADLSDEKAVAGDVSLRARAEHRYHQTRERDECFHG